MTTQATQRDARIKNALPIVRKVALRVVRRLPSHVMVDDLMSAGSEGLVRAMDAHDPDRHPPLEHYLEIRVRGAILDELRASDPMSRHGRRTFGMIRKTREALEARHGRVVEDREVAEHMGLSLERFLRLNQQLSRAASGSTPCDSSPDSLPHDSDLHASVESAELQRVVADATTRLTPRARDVLSMYYAEHRTQREIGEALGITESRVCQILSESINRLRAATEGDLADAAE